MNKLMMAFLFTTALVLTSIGAPALANVDDNDDNRIMNADNGKDKIGTGIRTENDSDRNDMGVRNNGDNDADLIRTTAAGDDGMNWEWIGLVGLLGLLGLRKRDDREVTD